jgi:hypothetical protein
MDQRLQVATAMFTALIARNERPLELDAAALATHVASAWRYADALIEHGYEHSPAFAQAMPSEDG